ncbi:MAG: tyrosinase family protein [candidate division Zixibacteria bacterium]|nr:tyrosinase family protein [candidate division Zixibacteria bacterium]MDH3937309.1 tyrosinase family protein [candidate division Zixibacteria bacterium]MDH4034884.1 tyrosinase family protein [candidate division Zixibacteria bacterium]
MYCRQNFIDVANDTDKLDRLADALNELYDRGVIAEFADQHNTFFNNGIHWVPQFLPWHRHFLLRLEQEMQAIDSRISLPFWDWTRADGRSLEADPWLSFFGGRANSGGRFDHWDLVRTQPEPTTNTLPTVAEIKEELRNKANFFEYRAIECQSHFPGHTWTGGTMAGGSSPADPLFYLHHCNIDRLWAVWQLNNPGAEQYSTDRRPSCDNTSIAAVALGDPMVGGATPESMLVHTDLGYRYPRDLGLEVEVAGDSDFAGFISGDPVEITLATPQIIFNDVPEGDTTKRAALFQITGCGSLLFEVTNGPTGSFSLFEPGPYPHPSGSFPTDELRIWVMFTGGAPDTIDPGGVMSVVARDDDGNVVGTFNDIPILANSVARPSVAVALILDESGSMLSDAGNNRTRISVLRDAATTFVDQLYDDNGLTLVSFANSSDKLTDLQVAGSLTSSVRNEARGEIASHGPPNNQPLTSIGSGLEEAANIYGTSSIASDFDIKASIVFTDGYNTIAPDVDDAAAFINERVYAVGVADAANVNNDTLFKLADDSGGYTLVTGAIAQDDEFLLEKFFIQILAGVMNRDIVSDPGGWLTAGQIARVPFLVTKSDIEFDAIALTRHPHYVVVGLETPDGTIIDESKVPSGAYRAGTNSNSFRIVLPLVNEGKGHWEGKWNLLLALRFKRRDDDVKRRHAGAISSTQFGGTASLPYEALVHTRSNLRLSVNLDQSDITPGSTLLVRAVLSEYGQPLETHSKVTATVTRPDRTTQQLSLVRSAPGEYDTSVISSQSGVYRFHIKANGFSSRGQAFSREHLLTAVVGRPSEKPATPPRDYNAAIICELMKCLTSKKVVNEHFIRKLESIGVDWFRLRDCIEKYCRVHDKSSLIDILKRCSKK